jgi:hypothetical protein
LVWNLHIRISNLEDLNRILNYLEGSEINHSPSYVLDHKYSSLLSIKLMAWFISFEMLNFSNQISCLIFVNFSLKSNKSDFLCHYLFLIMKVLPSYEKSWYIFPSISMSLMEFEKKRLFLIVPRFFIDGRI